jgi:tetratricopeptide (TPR) repeat protein
MKQRFRLFVASYRAVPVLVLLVLILVMITALVVTATNPAASPTEHNTPDYRYTVQELYALEASAARDGVWTADMHRRAGDLLVAVGDLNAAVIHWEAAHPTDASLNRRLAQSYLDLQRWDAAADALNRALKLDAGDSWSHYQLGLLLAAFDPDRATDHLRAAAQNTQYRETALGLLETILTEPQNYDPSEAPGAMRAGLMLARHRHWPQAELAFRYAAAVNHPYPEALAYVGLARHRQGKDGAMWFHQAAAFGPNHPPVYYLNGLHLRELGDYMASLRSFAQAAALHPDNPAYYAELGNAYWLLFNYEEAEYWLRMAVAASNNAPEFQTLLAVFYAEEGYNLSPEYLEVMQQTRDQLPSDPDLIAGFGWTLHTLGDTASGLTEIDAALALDPDSAVALYYKARILIETNDLSAVQSLLRRVADSDTPYALDAEHLLDLLTPDEAGGDE